ncbi:MAG: hypothetical protein KDB23_13375, partial [Planctomycetales bacterium]|nr:hypothetical protein [Planctomycetales bacterium]
PAVPFGDEFTLLDVNSAGELVFSAKLDRSNPAVTRSNDDALFVTRRDPIFNLDELTLIAREGTPIPTAQGQLFDVPQARRGWAISDTGAVVFSSGSDAVFLANVASDTVTDFVWSGACNESNWHASCGDSNWNDKQDNSPAFQAPGDVMGLETALIATATVNITERPVILKRLDAGGALVVEQPLTVKEASSIRNLSLAADLKTDNLLTLTGQNVWLNGTLGSTDPGVLVPLGDSRVVVGPTAVLELRATEASRNKRLNTNLTIQGAVMLQDANGEAGILTLGNDTELLAETTGELQMRGSTVLQGTGEFKLLGRLKKIAPPPELDDPAGGTAQIGVPMNVSQQGIIDVRAGRLVFTADGSHTQASYQVSKDATLEFSGATTNVFKVNASGDGDVLIRSGTYEVATGGTASFNMNGINGGSLTIGFPQAGESGPTVKLKGTLRNDGSSIWFNGKIEKTDQLGEFENTGTLEMRPTTLENVKLDAPLVNLTDESDSSKGGLIRQSGFLVIGAGSIHNQRGATYSLLDNSVVLELFPGEQYSFRNDGLLTSSTTSTFDSVYFNSRLVNQGRIEVKRGQLNLSGESTHDAAQIEISEGAKLVIGQNALDDEFAPRELTSSTFRGTSRISGGTVSIPGGILVAGELTIQSNVEEITSNRSLQGGHWVIEDNGLLTLNDQVHITELDTLEPEGVHVEFHGSGRSPSFSVFEVTEKFLVANMATLRFSGVDAAIADLSIRSGGTVTIDGNSDLRTSQVSIQVGEFDESQFSIEKGSKLDLTALDVGGELLDPDVGVSLRIDGVLNAIVVRNEGGGAFYGTGTINGQTFDNKGELSGGNSPGILTFNVAEFLQRPESSLLAELGGSQVGTQYDQIRISGTTELDGTLDIRFLDRFLPAPSDRFVLLASEQGILGRFSNTPNDVLRLIRGSFDVVYTDTTVELSNFRLNGDFNQNAMLDVEDISLLVSAINRAENDMTFDVNTDNVVDNNDLRAWVHDIALTYFGDANLDGEFNSGDLIKVFQAGTYEDAITGNSTWETGDWNGDGDFTTGDLIVAFQDGGYELGPNSVAIPEPKSSLLPILIGMIAWQQIARRT